jgi:predicted N-formylglutamate amidohydrolase
MNSLLGSADPAPFEIIGPEVSSPVLLVCDHASKLVPRTLEDLGLAPARLDEHIGWDIGAAAVTRRLAPMLGAGAVLCGYSRLVIDCNRDPADPSSIPAVSDGVTIPGNQHLSASDRAARHDDIFVPYHGAIASRLGPSSALISVHSFTPVMNGFARPWHCGILWDDDPRIAVPLMAALGSEAHLIVGDNQPYSARDPVGYTVEHHAQAKGLPHVAIELRQDLIASEAGAQEWAARLARVLTPILKTREE